MMIPLTDMRRGARNGFALTLSMTALSLSSVTKTRHNKLNNNMGFGLLSEASTIPYPSLLFIGVSGEIMLKISPAGVIRVIATSRNYLVRTVRTYFEAGKYESSGCECLHCSLDLHEPQK